MALTSEKTIGRLSLYRRILQQLIWEGQKNVYSHELAVRAQVTAAQVRRDFMTIGYSGSPVYGYDVNDLILSIAGCLDKPEGQTAALVGIGHLGRAILAYLLGRRPKLKIVAAFDNDAAKVNRVIHGCRCYHMDEFTRVVEAESIKIGVIAVPADHAQAVCNAMVKAGMNGILDFAPAYLRVPPHVYVETIDIAMSLEKVAYFSRKLVE